MTVERRPGPSVRLKLTLSYAGFVTVAGLALLVVAWMAGQYPRTFALLRQLVPDDAADTAGGLVPGNSNFFLREFAPAAAVVLVGLLVFGLAGGWLLAGRMLSPLHRITDATRRATGGSLSHRIELEGRNDELRQLADDFDAMLAQLEAHVAEQQRFAANASHELRTPLAVTQTLLDVARNDPGGDTAELVERLHAVNTRAIDMTEALLVLSRTDRRAFTREDVDLSLVAEEAVETLLPLAERNGVRIEASGDVAPAVGSPTLLLQMTTNLVQNGIVHNVEADGWVRVETAVHDESVVLTVVSTGEVLTPALVATLTEPFQRGTARVRGDHAGVGLGLAIVASIARAHDGTLTLAPRQPGGLAATVHLPRA